MVANAAAARRRGELGMGRFERSNLIGAKLTDPLSRLSQACYWAFVLLATDLEHELIKPCHEEARHIVTDLPKAHYRAGSSGLKEPCR